MYDKFLEPLFAGEKLLTNPKQIFFPLLPNGNAGSNTGMDKHKIPTTERELEGVEKFEVRFGYRLGQFFGQSSLLSDARINRWLESVGHESFEAAAESPFIQNCWHAQKAMNQGLVIAFEKNGFFSPRASEQKIQHFSRGRPAVDIVADKNHDRATGRVQYTIHVDLAEQGFQKIRAAMNISDRVNPEAIRQSRCGPLVLQ
jgi:hypothetical protein